MNITADSAQKMSRRQLLDNLAAATVALNVEDNATGVPWDQAGPALMILETEIMRRMGA